MTDENTNGEADAQDDVEQKGKNIDELLNKAKVDEKK